MEGLLTGLVVVVVVEVVVVVVVVENTSLVHREKQDPVFLMI